MVEVKISFLKMSGEGNDFVVVDRLKVAESADWKSIIPGMCDRRRGIGADGVILITPAPDADFTMD